MPTPSDLQAVPPPRVVQGSDIGERPAGGPSPRRAESVVRDMTCTEFLAAARRTQTLIPHLASDPPPLPMLCNQSYLDYLTFDELARRVRDVVPDADILPALCENADLDLFGPPLEEGKDELRSLRLLAYAELVRVHACI